MKYLMLVLILVLQSCASGSYKQYAFNDDSESLDSSEGVILFRTVNRNIDNNLSGFLVNFTNLETGEIIKNVAGSWGYPKQTEFALKVPNGEYELSYVFLYDGGVSPNESGFRVRVNGGEYLYIGTILKSWGFPNNPIIYGALISEKKYSAKEYCGFWVCGSKDSEVYIFSSGSVPEEIYQQYPNLKNEDVKNRLLN